MYRWVDHTGELELKIESESEAGIFSDAAQAVGELLIEEEAPPADARRKREITVTAVDRPRLLAAWLGELAFLAETQGLVPTGLAHLQIGEGVVDATIVGHVANPPHLIKAVTYHRLSFEQLDGRWHARAVLDV
jgi:SHS2 domain-containing protein